jgi:hypothetical protein
MVHYIQSTGSIYRRFAHTRDSHTHVQTCRSRKAPSPPHSLSIIMLFLFSSRRAISRRRGKKGSNPTLSCLANKLRFASVVRRLPPATGASYRTTILRFPKIRLTTMTTRCIMTTTQPTLRRLVREGGRREGISGVRRGTTLPALPSSSGWVGDRQQAPLAVIGTTTRSFSSPPPSSGGGVPQMPPWMTAEAKPGEFLDRFTTNLTHLAAQAGGKMDPVIGRHEEIRRCLQILARRTKNSR